MCCSINCYVTNISIGGYIQHLFMYLAQIINGAVNAFQGPAKNVAVTMLVPKDYYGKANGFRSFSDQTSKILAPIFAGALMAWVGIKGIMIFDLISFGFAFIKLLLFIIVPKHKKKKDDDLTENKNKWIEEMKYGFEYIYDKKGFFGY